MPDAIPASDYLHRAQALAEKLVRELAIRKKTIAAAESCTAGLASGFIAGVPGASEVFWGSYVTYTADAKTRMLGVPGELIKKHGAVSRSVALAMAEGALERSGALLAFSVTGLAGPDGDGTDTPVGTVWIGFAERDGESNAEMYVFGGSRNDVREAAAAVAFAGLLERIRQK
jgi:PncC family amidohydrolase